MGRLYVAEQTGIAGFAKIVAVKRILPHLANSETLKSLFLHEARVAARLEHPNVVATHELGEIDGTYFIAMEYLPGEDLRTILARCQPIGPMPVDFAAFLAHQCACGLHYAHQLRDSMGRSSGLVHRDVNPSNIFVTYHGAVKLLDFGVAKVSASHAGSAPGVFKGKYAYCAPEQLDDSGIDPRTDVFSLGIALWECLTGNRLFGAASDAATIDAVRGQTIVPPSLLRPEVPLGLNHITMRALFRDPAHRYQSAAEMAEALDQFLAEDKRRPTARVVGQWLEGLFGADRAALKRAIAQGNDVEQAIALLTQPEPPASNRRDTSEKSPSGVRLRQMWSTSFDRTTPSRGSTAMATPPPVMSRAPAPPPEVSLAPVRRRIFAALLASSAAVVLATGLGAVWWLRPAQTAPPTVADLGALSIESSPPGAHVFLDGNPTGLVTPATLRGLPLGRPLELRVSRTGFAPVQRRITLAPGPTAAQTFTLTETSGTVRLEGLPQGAHLYVDDARTDGRLPFTAAVGSHRFRVEHDNDVVFSQEIQVRTGQQTVRIRTERHGR